MKISLFRMPWASGVPLYRETPMTTASLLRPVNVNTNNHFFTDSSRPEILIGSDIIRAPMNLHKVIHVCDVTSTVFETVFCVKDHVSICLYSKIVSDKTNIFVSMNAINTFKAGSDSAVPLPLIVSHKYWGGKTNNIQNQFLSIIPPIFDRDTFDEFVTKTIDIIECGSINDVYSKIYKSMYESVPSVLEALISGRFVKSPLYEIQDTHPYIRLSEDKWVLKDIFDYKSSVSSGATHHNHQEFDFIAHKLMLVRASKLSITTLMSHAIDGFIDLSVTKFLYDPYSNICQGYKRPFDQIKKELSDILFRSVLLYCQIYDIDFRVFMKNENSSISIEKNIFDEVTISFHDLVHDRYVSFYTYYPIIALGTFGVGRFIEGNY